MDLLLRRVFQLCAGANPAVMTIAIHPHSMMRDSCENVFFIRAISLTLKRSIQYLSLLMNTRRGSHGIELVNHFFFLILISIYRIYLRSCAVNHVPESLRVVGLCGMRGL